MANLKEIVNSIGDKIPQWTNQILTKLSDFGLEANDLSERLVSIILILLVAWLVLTFITGLKKPVIWIIKILGVVLIASILYSTFI